MDPHSKSKQSIFNSLDNTIVKKEVYENAVHIRHFISFLLKKRYLIIINSSKIGDFFGHFINEKDFALASKTFKDLPYVSGDIKLT